MTWHYTPAVLRFKIPALAQVSRPGQERYLLFVFYVDIIYQNPQSDQPKFITDFNFPIVILFKFRQTTSNGRIGQETCASELLFVQPPTEVN
jgi:hypothetical protein